MLRNLIILLYLVGFSLSCATKKSESVPTEVSTEKVSKSDWQIRMQKISNSFSTLLPLVLSSDAYNNPDNYYTIEKETKSLSEMAHDISNKGGRLRFDADPALEYISREFNKDMGLAYIELKKGHRTYARQVIQNTTNYCITCHTRNDQGSQNVLFNVQPDLSSLTPMERANYFTAVRQFDRALDEFDKAMTSPRYAETSPKEWAIGLKKSLAIAIRVKRNPSLALELVSRLRDANSIPETIRKSSPYWREAILEWRKEKDKEVGLSRNAKLAKAKLLVQKAQSVGHKALSDAGLVYHLRASMFLHDLLKNKKSDNAYAEALYYSGMAAEGLQDINLWTYDEAYYEACIRFRPHTEIATKCYLRFEALQLFVGKILSDENMTLSEDAKKRLDELKSLASK